METKRKPTLNVGNPEKRTYNISSKGKHYYTPLKEIRSLFFSGRKFTAKELNQLTLSNDARKCISDLRTKENLNIVDQRIEHGNKVYWLDEKNYQIGDIMENVAQMPLIDPQSGETNIMALLRIRKEGQK